VRSFCHIYAQWDQTGQRLATEARHLLNLGLVADTVFGFAQAEQHGDILREMISAGGLCAPSIYPANLDPNFRDPNWWKYSEEQCEVFLAETARRYAQYNLGPLQAVNTYTPGNAFVSACRRRGVRYILGFCAPTVIEDGGWEIAHYGSPLSPYFASEDDYRKPAAAGRTDAVLISSMELRNPLVCLNHWSEGPWCPLNALAADRWLEPSADPLPFLQIAEDWIRQGELSGRSAFFHVNLQYFFAGRCYEHNRRALEWLAVQRDRGRLEIGGLTRWRERLQEGGGFTRQTTYWRGEMMGFHVGHRPGSFPDVVVDESLEHQAVWQRPDPLPKRLYDYMPEWNYPAFVADGSAPASAEFGGIRVEIEGQPHTELSREWTVRIWNESVARVVPVVIWDAFENWDPPFRILDGKDSWTFRIVPHPGGSGGALILEGMAFPGETTLKIDVSAQSPSHRVLHKTWAELIEAQTFFRGGRPYTLLAAQTPEPFAILARIRKSDWDVEPVIAEHLIGLNHEKKTLSENEIALRFDGSRLVCWHRFWGVSANEIELIGVEACLAELKTRTMAVTDRLAMDLRPERDVFQVFGNIRDQARWDRNLAREAGVVEQQRMNVWFQESRPTVGRIVIELHAGLFLPRGSITKVLGHEFDFLKCAEGYGCRELCVDYPQGWDWGVAAWVQWRHLRLQLDGLRPGGGSYCLHLHAFDPEGRDITQRVHFFNPEDTESAPIFDHLPIHRKVELCVVQEWTLPRGLEGRWQPSALCSVMIPEACLQWPSIGVWIAPLEKGKLHDWIADRGAPGMLSHLWVSHYQQFPPLPTSGAAKSA